ncbi:MAG: TIR domain-containing protein [Magnetococcales bacterium]|nr:TIR domain-containing protein [Magnetococcales bacterium]
MGKKIKDIRFDIAISFSGNERDFARKIASRLDDNNINVFFDEFYKAELWGEDLYEELGEIYMHRSKYCLMLVSESYKDKKWTQHERRSIHARTLLEGPGYVLPVLIDDTVLPGLPDTINYIDSRNILFTELIDIILSKLGIDSEEQVRRKIENAKIFQGGRRANCSVCGMGYSDENIWYCSDCPSYYCYRCVEGLGIIEGAVDNKRKCGRCRDGRVG